jgi:1-acyl-sn-glycerol-3-phosphate acyltransferase
MWLLPIFSPFSRFALRVFYRFEVTGGHVPAAGPVLLVANHPNSLLDPAVVVAVAGRPVRFLAKAPLFKDPLVGWLVRGAGSIPVYRRQDDPAAMAANDDTFRAVHEALHGGSAVGLFPEGISHTSPAMAPLKTGAARIALGAAERTGAFSIVPVGLVFRDKGTFRSDALAVVGEPVAWHDLAGRPEADRAAVAELTGRIAEALARVTINLERWEDAPLLETAEAVYATEYPTDPDPAARVRRIREVAGALSRLRRDERGTWRSLAREVAGHARALRVLGMTPGQLRGGNDPALAAEWVARQAAFFALGVPLAALGTALYFVPYRLTRPASGLTRPTDDVRATSKVLMGGILHLAWTAGLAVLAGWRWGAWAGAGALLALPMIGVVTLRVRDRWRRATGEARRFVLRARRGDAVEELRARQRDLAGRLHALWEEVRPRAAGRP